MIRFLQVVLLFCCEFFQIVLFFQLQAIFAKSPPAQRSITVREAGNCVSAPPSLQATLQTSSENHGLKNRLPVFFSENLFARGKPSTMVSARTACRDGFCSLHM